MQYDMTEHVEHQKQKAIDYFCYATAFLLFIFLSDERWITLLCSCFFIMTSACVLAFFTDSVMDNFADAVFGPVDFSELELVPISEHSRFDRSSAQEHGRELGLVAPRMIE